MQDYCAKCSGLGVIALGLVVLLNYFWLSLSWWFLIGVLLVVLGLARIFKPHCGCGQGCCIGPLPKEVPRKKARA